MLLRQSPQKQLIAMLMSAINGPARQLAATLQAYVEKKGGAGADAGAVALVGGEAGTGDPRGVGEPEGLEEHEIEAALAEQHDIAFAEQIPVPPDAADLKIGEIVDQPLSLGRLGLLKTDEVRFVGEEFVKDEFRPFREGAAPGLLAVVGQDIERKNTDAAHGAFLSFR